jgi:CAAD domains of cyanobacterial aminoacyl-tRNA synthetase
MKNNIIKDDREISMKSESLTTDISDRAESTVTNENSPTEILEMNTNTLADLPDPTEPIEPMIADEPIADPAVAMQSSQTELIAFFEQAKSTATNFFNNNRPLFITLGWIVMAIIGTKFVFATLGIIDDIPLVTPLIKLVGLVSVVRFAWRYLIREHDRQELIEIIDRTKVEILGDHQSLS